MSTFSIPGPPLATFASRKNRKTKALCYERLHACTPTQRPAPACLRWRTCHERTTPHTPPSLHTHIGVAVTFALGETRTRDHTIIATASIVSPFSSLMQNFSCNTFKKLLNSLNCSSVARRVVRFLTMFGSSLVCHTFAKLRILCATDCNAFSL